MRKQFRKHFIFILSFLVCGVLLILVFGSERYNIKTTAQSINRNEFVNVYLDCKISNDFLRNHQNLNGQVSVEFDNNVEIVYDFCNPITNISKDIYMVHIAGTNAVPSAEYGLVVPTGFLYFEEDMDTFLLSQTHPYLGDFVGVKKGAVSDEIIQKYVEIGKLSE